MEVNFNNLRKQTAFALDDVIRILNQNIHPNNDGISLDDGKWLRCDKAIVIDVEDLQNKMDELRQNIGFLLCCYEENNPEIADLSDVKIGWFNPDNNDS